MKKKLVIIMILVIAVLIVLLCFGYVRKRSNHMLAAKLRMEFKQWAAGYEKIPDEENGAILITEGEEEITFAGLSEDKDNSMMPYRLYHDEYSLDCESDLKLIKEILALNKGAIEKIEKGLSYEKWRYTPDYSDFQKAKIASLTSSNNAAKLFILRAEVAEHEGRSSDAISDYIKAIRLGVTLSQDPVLINRMIEVSVENMVFEKLLEKIVAREFDKGNLSQLVKAMKQLHPIRKKLSKAYESDYYHTLSTIARDIEGKLKFEIPDEILTEFPPEARAKLRAQMEAYYPKHSAWIHDYSKEWEIAKTMREVMVKADPEKMHDAPLEIREGTLDEKLGIDKEGPYHGYLIRALSHGAGTGVLSMTDCEIMWRATMITAAIQIFKADSNRLPKNLSELEKILPKKYLTDPFSGKYFVYKIQGNDFLLYSVGRNGKDDNAKNSRPILESHIGFTDPDIILHKPAK
ncbi:MAG: hypothetical protein E3J72_04440 [Planctomycetota bacterium]|nr:MAG: hypothetical protein E3J72_04440 [Planctomycetota bacterium]